MSIKKTFIFACFFFLLFTLCKISIQIKASDDLNKKTQEINDKISKYESELSKKRKEIKTLSDQIKYMNSELELTILKISQTNEKINLLEIQIDDLSKKINILNSSLDEVSALFINRVITTYKISRFSFIDLLFSSGKFTDFFKKIYYLQFVQNHDRKMMVTMEEIRLSYDKQKSQKEEKQKELEKLKVQLSNQKTQLNQQKRDKEYLLTITKNDEIKYQNMIAEAISELQAIRAISAGKSEEKEIGEIKEGEKIATVILGKSPCSTGTHLHFEVHDGNLLKDPSVYLKSTNIIWENSPDSSFSFSGSWNWPISESIVVTQGYGYTFYARVQGYYSGQPHTGLDITNRNNLDVKSVQSGILYNGSVKCGNGYLRYVRVKHKDSNLSTYYLHINYEKF